MADAGTVTVTEQTFGIVKKITWAWTSSAGGAADKQTTKVYDGKLVALETIPAGGGSAPSDNYGITVADADGHDVLAGAGAARDTANTEIVAEASLGAVAGSPLYLHVTAAGNGKGGTAILWVR